jgi:MFS family permease
MMIIWLNGGFAAGKTTLAQELHRRLPDAVVYNPEDVGLMLWKWMRPNDDFQHLPSWRELVVATALSLSFIRRSTTACTFQVCFAVLGASFVVWLVATSWLGLLAFAILLGTGYGGWIALQPTVLAELFGVRGLGGLVGLVYTAAGVGALVGPPLAGVLVDATGGYRWAIAAAGLCGIGAFLALLPLPPGPAFGSRARPATPPTS